MNLKKLDYLTHCLLLIIGFITARVDSTTSDVAHIHVTKTSAESYELDGYISWNWWFGPDLGNISVTKRGNADGFKKSENEEEDLDWAFFSFFFSHCSTNLSIWDCTFSQCSTDQSWQCKHLKPTLHSLADHDDKQCIAHESLVDGKMETIICTTFIPLTQEDTEETHATAVGSMG